MSKSPSLDVLLPAGGHLPADLTEACGTKYKALIEFEGEPLAARVIRAIRDSERARRIVLISGEAVKDRLGSDVDAALPEANTGPENLFRGLEYLMASSEPPTRVLLATCDLPFLKAEHVSTLLNLTDGEGASQLPDISVPLIRRSEFEASYPGTSSTFVKLRGEQFTLGGMFVMDVQAMLRARPHIEDVFAQRKSKLGMAKLLGLAFLIRFLTNRLTLSDVEAKIRAMLNCSGKAVIGVPAEFAYDIDDLDDYDHALRLSAEMKTK